MSNYIPFETPGGVIWVEIEESVNGSLLISAFQDKIFTSYEDVIVALTANAQMLRGMLEGLQPSGIEISFGIKAGVGPGSIVGPEGTFFALSKGTDDAHLCVKVRWEDQDDES